MSILTRSARRWQALSPVLLPALALAACAAPQRKPAPTVAPPPPPPVAEKPRPLAEAAQNRVALLVPLTGANAPVGQSIANAANLALLDVGDSRVNLRIYDTAGGAAAAATRALAEGAGLILGPLLAADTAQVGQIAGARGVPVISYSNDTAVAGGSVWVLGFQPAQSIARVVAHARGRGASGFAALVPSGTYGQRAQTAFVRAVNDAGGRVTGITTYVRDPAKMQAAARTVSNYDARARSGGKPVLRPDGTVAAATGVLPPAPFQALLVADSGAVAAQFLPPLAKFGVPPGAVMLLGTEIWNTEPGLSRVPALKGAMFASVPDDRWRKLAERYRAKYGGNPSRLASLGYDSVLLVNAIAGNWPLGAPFPKAALGGRDGFAGVDGVFRFTPGNVAERALEVQQIGAGTTVVVSPAAKGF